ncbi:MAG: DNA mismatch repair protein MutS [Planctomycetota bacterium]
MKNTQGETLTPMMRQFKSAKKAHPDCLLFFRMGDFYELFFDDAKTASQVLGIALTSRSKGEGGVPMAGVPVKAYEQYLFKLIRKGFKVAICDQIEDPKFAKGIVDRAVTRIVSAGTLTEEELLDRNRNNFLMAIAPGRKKAGIAWIDLSTATFLVSEAPMKSISDELNRIDPSEILITEATADPSASLYATVRSLCNAPITPITDYVFDRMDALDALRIHFNVRTLEGFGVDEASMGIGAAGAILHYLKETQRGKPDQVRALIPYQPAQYLTLDRPSRRSLELVANMRDGSVSHTLLSCLDYTATAMGGRLLRDWILLPSAHLETLRKRTEGVDELFQTPALQDDLNQCLQKIFDLERITTKIVANRANGRDMANLRQSVDALPQLMHLLGGLSSDIVAEYGSRLCALDEMGSLLHRAIVEQPPATLKEGGIIAQGYNEELDELRAIRSEGRGFIKRFQERETERTRIPNLKVGYNRVFGFYIEITHAHKNLIPDDYIRKQTLKNAERYITPELKEYEVKVLTSDERAKELEFTLFDEIRGEVAQQAEILQQVASAVAGIDVIRALAEAATVNSYVRPVVNDGNRIHIIEGRHPVLERMPEVEAFVPNDALLDDEGRLIILTGPNMAGKSTYLRQIGLIVIMAQMGSFVPADSAEIGLVDRIFTRVGASDDLARGSSTFMVEMVETANILNNATDRSLIILDEVGRGTSTFDGLSLAWAISEYIQKKICARTLFATHYHQLTRLSEELQGVKNLSTAVREWQNEIIFLRKIIEGGTDRSYGIHVARLAGVPDRVLVRASEILKEIEVLSPDIGVSIPMKNAPNLPLPKKRQATLFNDEMRYIREALEKIDIDATSPMQALIRLKEIKDMLP